MASRLLPLLCVGFIGSSGAVGLACSAEATDGADQRRSTDGSDTDPAETEDSTSSEELNFEVTFTGDGVSCGDERCQDALIEGSPFGAAGCCADESTSQCGLNMALLGVALNLRAAGCEALLGPTESSDECPASDPIPVLLPELPDGLVLPSCCQPSGQCGFATDFGGFGFGCVDPSRFGQRSAGDCEP